MSVLNFKKYTLICRSLPLLPEIGQSQACRRLVFFLSLETGDHQYQDRYQIGQHLEDFLHRLAQGHIGEQDVQSAKQNGSPDRSDGFPQSEDYQGYGQPATVTESVILLGTAQIFHDKIQAAKTADHTADTGSQVFVAGYIDAGGIGSGGVFAYCS